MMSDFHLQKSRPSYWTSLLLPAAMICLALILDSSLPQANTVGLLFVISLGILAFLIRPAQILAWTIIMACVFAFTLVTNVEVMARDQALLKISVRIATLLAGGCVASLASLQRMRLRQSYNNVMDILRLLPSPVVISDANGTILFCNQNACLLAGRSHGDLLGTSFFTYFSPPEKRGQTLSEYFTLMDASNTTSKDLQLVLQQRAGTLVSAKVINMKMGRQSIAVTIFQEDVTTSKLIGQETA